MADNRIRLKQLYTPELSGYILSVSSGDTGPTGPTGPVGPNTIPSGADKSIQYSDGGIWAGSTIYYDKTTENLGLAGTTSPTAKASFGDYSSSDNSSPTLYFHESGAGNEYGVNFDQTYLNYFISTGSGAAAKFGTLSHLNEFTEVFKLSSDLEVQIPNGNLNVPKGGITGQNVDGLGLGTFGSGVMTSGVIIGSGYADLPTGSSYPGTAGEFAWGSGHFYVCTGANLWGRVAITGF
tara:strand:+ start:424 stop:1134 length:711 start_codon:yes stop_codon:yes gene_type:complete